MLDQALQKVVATGSENKINLFKAVLAAHLLSETEPVLTEVYLKIIGRLTEKQILILDGLSQPAETDFIHLHKQIHLIQPEIRTFEAENNSEVEYVKDNSQVAGRNLVIKDKTIEIAKLKERANQIQWYRFEI